MLVVRRLCTTHQRWLTRLSKSLEGGPKFSTNAEVTKAPEADVSSKVDKIHKKPLAKNFLVGAFDADLLIFPEIDFDGRPKGDRMSPVSSADVRIVRQNDEAVEKLRQLLRDGSLSITLNSQLKQTQRFHHTESLDLDIGTAVSLEAHQLVYDAIEKYGTEAQKSKYLKKMANGEMIGGYAQTEITSGSDLSTLSSTALLNDEDTHFIINGKKCWVTNGSVADVFLVFCKTNSTGGVMTDLELSALIVERDYNGITVEKMNSVGLTGCGISEVLFSDVTVPRESLLGDIGDGYDIGVDKFRAKRYAVPCCLLGTMKKTLFNALNFVKGRKQIPIDLMERELIKIRISKVALDLYAFESVLYYVAGLHDMFEIDTSFESAVIQLLCAGKAVDALRTTTELLGALRYDKNLNYCDLRTDIEGLTLTNHTIDLLKLYISLIGIEHAGKTIGEEVKKIRNPFNFPGFVMKKLIASRRQSNDNPKLTLELHMPLHPSLQPAAELLEYGVLRLGFAIEHFLSRYGKEVINKQGDLLRIAESVEDLLEMAAVLSRSSRSYCTGILNCDDELKCATVICKDRITRIKANLTDVINGFESSDLPHSDIGAKFISHGTYALQHPLIRNIE